MIRVLTACKLSVVGVAVFAAGLYWAPEPRDGGVFPTILASSIVLECLALKALLVR